jgi:hypothetical protein
MTESERNALEKYLTAVTAVEDFNKSLLELNEDKYDSMTLMHLNKLSGYLDIIITAFDRVGELMKQIIPPAKS